MMANPFVAGPGDPTADLPGPETFNNLKEQWSTFLEQPGGRAALLNAGIALMQPPHFGDTATSQLGRAIGAGGEAVGRQEAMDIRQMEAESKAQQREAAANLAGARAATVGQVAAGQQEKLQSARTIAQLKAWNDLHRGYETYRSGVMARNIKRKQDILNPNQPEEPLQDMNTWITTQPSARAIAEASGLFSGQGGGTAPQQPVRVNTPAEARALPSGTPIILPDGTQGTVP